VGIPRRHAIKKQQQQKKKKQHNNTHGKNPKKVTQQLHSLTQNFKCMGEKANHEGGRANTNTHSKITTHEKVLFVKQVLLILSCLSFAVQCWEGWCEH
jgi:hypothetical protein